MKRVESDLESSMGRRRKSVAETLTPQASSDEKLVGLIAYVPEEHRRLLKVHCAQTDQAMTEVVRKILANYLKEQGLLD